MTALVSHIPGPIDKALEDLGRGEEYARNAKAQATRTAYASDMADFASYCAANGLSAVPAAPQTVVSYISALASRVKITTLRRRLVAISQAHKLAGLESPTAHQLVREVVKGIARDPDVQLRSRKTRKTALTTEKLQATLLALRSDAPTAVRDRALLLLGFAAALRRSELVALDVEDLEFDERGVIVTIRRSKTDQGAVGAQIDVPRLKNAGICPVRALEAWIAASGISSGAVFLSFSIAGKMQAQRMAGRDVARCIKRVTSRADLDGDFSGHSLRRGYITSGVRKGVSAAQLMQRTRHKSVAVFNGYVDEARLFIDNPLSAIFS